MAIDFYNNYMTNFHDNPFETDGSMHNVRVMRNMMINSASHAFCNQPSLGGPVYWIRNIALSPAGRIDAADAADRRACSSTTTRSCRRRPPQARRTCTGATICSSARTQRPQIFSINTFTNYTSSDYNGFRPNPGADVFVPVELAAGGGARPTYAAPGHTRRARDAPVRDAGRVQPGDGQDRHSVLRRLRRLRERAPARRAGSARPCRRSTRPRISTSG